jgi:hypothetical protein
LPDELIQKWIIRAKKEGQKSLEWDLEILSVSKKHFTYKKLEKLWKIAIDLNKFDLAWRIATILKSRLYLSEAADKSWQLSTESKQPFFWILLSQKDIRKCIFSSKNENIKLLSNYFFLLEDGSFLKALEKKKDSFNSFNLDYDLDEKIKSVLSKTQFLAFYKKEGFLNKIFRAKKDVKIMIPDFCSISIMNHWSLIFLRIIDILGVQLWDWDLKRLLDKIKVSHTKSLLETKSKVNGSKRYKRDFSSVDFKDAFLRLKNLEKKFP